MENFRAWLSTATGIVFSDRVDLTCSKYDYTGGLAIASVNCAHQS
jgi:hypothetical protein